MPEKSQSPVTPNPQSLIPSYSPFTPHSSLLTDSEVDLENAILGTPDPSSLDKALWTRYKDVENSFQ